MNRILIACAVTLFTPSLGICVEFPNELVGTWTRAPDPPSKCNLQVKIGRQTADFGDYKCDLVKAQKYRQKYKFRVHCKYDDETLTESEEWGFADNDKTVLVINQDGGFAVLQRCTVP